MAFSMRSRWRDQQTVGGGTDQGTLHHRMSRLKKRWRKRVIQETSVAGDDGDLLTDHEPEEFGEMVPPRERNFAGEGDFTAIGQRYLRFFIEMCGLPRSARVLDVGCGIGRMAAALTTYLDSGALYEGFDVVPRGISWCKERISSRYPNFQFQLADIFNKRYNPGGTQRACEYRFPYPDSHFDFVLVTSVFTHLLPADTDHYVREIARVLRGNGVCLATFFLLNEKSLGLLAAGRSSQDFKHSYGRCRTVDAQTPERAVGYEEDHIRILYRDQGLSVAEPIHFGNWCGRSRYLAYQDIVVARKRQEAQHRP